MPEGRSPSGRLKCCFFFYSNSPTLYKYTIMLIHGWLMPIVAKWINYEVLAGLEYIMRG